MLVGNHGFVASLGDYRQIVQIFEELLVVADWQDDGGSFAAVIGDVLECLAQGERLRL